MKYLVFCLLLGAAFAAPSRKPTFRRGLNKIVGGTEVTPGEIPYQLSFQDTSFGGEFHFCGASIYKDTWAICAGHCVQGEDFDSPASLQIVAGDHTLYSAEGNEQKIAVSKIIQHEDYNGFSISNDISLLQFASPLTFNSFVGPIALPAQGQVASGDCTCTGWGTTTEGGYSSDALLKVTMPIVSDADCRASYGESDIDDSMICAGVPQGGKDACQGDSGGPLACSDTGSPYLAGIVSWGYGCARPNYPGVYCEVAYYVDWVLANSS
nr:trypsin [Paralithodes camtschaticus]